MAQVTAQAVKTVLDEFRWRGMVHRTEQGQELYTPGLEDLLAREKVTGYIGFDPSADSLHVGSLLVVMALVHLQRHGHSPIAIVGGGTGMIGDPSGKTLERQLLTREQIEHNLQGIREQLSRFLDFHSRTSPARLVNNADWLASLNLLDFLRDIGKHFTVNYMLAKESVEKRMEAGISYTEFSYMLLQAYDFLVLYDRYGCVLQMGGSDQWGNITAGIDLIRRLRGAQAHGLVMPLVTTSTGVKFGKTEAGAVWLDASKTSPFRFYQFWLNTADADVIQYLKFFTLATPQEVAELEEAVSSHPERREAQRRLAEEVTRSVHGESGLRKAQAATAVLFGGEVSGLSVAELLDIFQDVPSLSLPRQRFEGAGMPLPDLVAEAGLAPSRSEARRLIQGGGVAVSNRKVSDVRHMVTLQDAVDGRVLVLRRGAREYRLVRLEG